MSENCYNIKASRENGKQNKKLQGKWHYCGKHKYKEHECPKKGKDLEEKGKSAINQVDEEYQANALSYVNIGLVKTNIDNQDNKILKYFIDGKRCPSFTKMSICGDLGVFLSP